MSQYDVAATASAGSSAGVIDSLLAYEAEEKDGKCKRWKAEIRMAQKELEDWWEQGDECENRFLDERGTEHSEERRFNIYTSNVQIMQSALYNAVPKVEVSRTFKDSNDDVARVAASILQRALQQDLDASHEDFSPAMLQAIQNRLVPGMGQAWLRLETTTQMVQMDQQQPLQDASTAVEQVVDQQVRTEWVHFKDFIWSPCRTWEERRWGGRRVMMTRDKLVERFGEEIGRAVPLKKGVKSTDDTNAIKPEELIFKQAEVYEIWDRERREVLWVCLDCDYLLDTKEDPLALSDFDTFPRPLFATTTTSRLVPVPDFTLWQDQYNSLDLVNTRIDLLVSACKVAGVYDRSSEGVQRLLQGNENTLVPVDNWAMFAEKGGIKGQVDWLPLDMIALCLERLRQAREDLKQQIYELTGIADIVRGATKASETLGAQELKAQFASVRIQSLQKCILDFGTQILRIKGEIAARHYTPEILERKANCEQMEPADLPYVPEALKLLKNPGTFQWRITIQPDSLAQTDYTKEKQERIEFLGAVSTYMEKAVVAVQQMPQLLPLTISLLKFGIAGFKVGKDVEGAVDRALQQIEQMVQQQAQQPPKPDPAQLKAEADIKASQMKAQTEAKAVQMKAQADVQAKVMTTKADIQAKQAKTQSDLRLGVAKAMFQQAQQNAKEMGSGPNGQSNPGQ